MNIKPLLKRKGISQKELAKRMGKDPGYVNRMLKPDTFPRYNTVVAMSEAAGISLDEIKEEIKAELKKEKENEDN